MIDFYKYLLLRLNLSRPSFESFLGGGEYSAGRRTEESAKERHNAALNALRPFTKELLEDYCTWLKEHYAPNSTKAIYADFISRAAIACEAFNVELPKRIENAKFKATPNESIYWTQDELRRIEAYKSTKNDPRSQKMHKYAQCVVLLCAYTGCRIGDAQILTLDNIQDGKYLVYTSEKTKTSTRVPLHPSVPRLIVERPVYTGYNLESLARNCNYVIKYICSCCDMEQPMTLFNKGKRVTRPKWAFAETHTGRRSFATNLFLDGYPLLHISRMMGHADHKMTARYIVSDIEEIPTGQRQFFKTNTAPKEKDGPFVEAFKILRGSIINIPAFLTFCEKNEAPTEELKKISKML